MGEAGMVLAPRGIEYPVGCRMTNTIVTTPVNVTGVPVINTVANHAEKPEKFNGHNFKRCFEAFRNLMYNNYVLYGLNDMKTEAMRNPTLDNDGLALRIDDKVVQDQRQLDDYDHQDNRQDQPKEEKVEPRRSKRARTEKSFGPFCFLLWVEKNLHLIAKGVTSSEWLNERSH
ncbi:hypothetical protein Tco_0502099 [Tanacetum coccineum]